MVTKQVENTFAVVLGAIIVISLMFTAGSSFFPNWSTVTGAPTIVGTVMPLISLFLFFVLIFGLVRRSSGSR